MIYGFSGDGIFGLSPLSEAKIPTVCGRLDLSVC
jgi:hypothetical protein